MEPGEVGAACPSACWMKGLLPRGQGGWSRGRGHGRQRECTRPLLLSLLRTLWRERKSERDYTAPPSTTLTPHAPEGALQGAPGCVPVRVCALMHTHVHVYTCVLLCAAMSTCVCVGRTRAGTCEHACTHTHPRVHAQHVPACTFMCTYAPRVCTRVCTHVDMCLHVCACVRVCGRTCLCCMCGHVFVCVRTVHATCAPVGVFS